MSYTPHTWESGETVTAEKLNNLEEGASGGGSLVITVTEEADTPSSGDTTYTLNKTWQEIHDALVAGAYITIIRTSDTEVWIDDHDEIAHITDCNQIIACGYTNGGTYIVGEAYNNGTYFANSPNGYPTRVEQGLQ